MSLQIHVKRMIKTIPIVGPLATAINRKLFALRYVFPGSHDYWINRYRFGGNSGAGSYKQLAEYKAAILNAFVKEKNIESIIEYGCGDGNQLLLAQYPNYIGFDVSDTAISLCKTKFAHDSSKSFKLVGEYGEERADLTLSLDVIYHLVEDGVFCEYMERLFDSSDHFVIIYSSNSNVQEGEHAPHVKHRTFTGWVERKRSEWRLRQYIPNRYPFTGNLDEGSFCDFYIYEMTSNSRISGS